MQRVCLNFVVRRRLVPASALLLAAVALALGAGEAAAAGPVRLVATVPNLGSIASEIGGDRLAVTTIAAPAQDAHHVFPRPGIIADMRAADLLLVNGLDLEIDWLPLLMEEAGNKKIVRGAPAYVDCSLGIHVVEIPVAPGGAERDVHPYGNPHYLTDPLNAEVVARTITRALKEADPRGAMIYESNRRAFVHRLHESLFGKHLVVLAGGSKLARAARAGTLEAFLARTSIDGAPLSRRLGGWLKRMAAVRGKPLVTYHEDLSYFSSRFGLRVIDHVEPAPGIPPSTPHLDELTARLRRGEARVLVTRPFLERRATDLLAEKTGVTVITLPLEVGGAPMATDYFRLFDHLANQIVGAFQEVEPVAGR